jgi:single-strand DNA-binding protein
MNRVLLTGRLTRDPEMRSLPSGKTVTNFSVATNEYRKGEEYTEYHSVVTWERLAEICGQFLGKGQMVSLEGRLQTRRWEDERKIKHYRTEIVASSVEMLSGRRKKDYAAEAAAQALATQAEVMGLDPLGPEDYVEGEPAEADEADQGAASSDREAEAVAA